MLVFLIRFCDSHGACGDSTITFDVVNSAPTAADDIYIVRDPVFLQSA